MIALVALVMSASVLFWHYIGYPLFLAVVSGIVGRRKQSQYSEANLPEISIIVIAHNESKVIERRIGNIQNIDYPEEKYEIIIASDASTDDTVARARSLSSDIEAFNNTPHNKSETRNLAVERASGEILVFTDADTRYEPDCVRRLVDQYADPDVGAVCGTLVSEDFEADAIGRGMGLYWRWEQWMKRLQGRLGILVKMSGANMSMRAEAFEPVSNVTDIDQVAGFTALSSGFRSTFEPRAVAHETFPTSITGEFSTRQRLTIRALTAISENGEFLDVRKHPLISVNVASYWALRYFVPVLLIIAFITSMVASVDYMIARVALVAQCLFYFGAGLGYLNERKNLHVPIVQFPFSYCLANTGILYGLVRFLKGDRILSYE